MVNRIRELLEARQLSPTQFADLIGVGRPVMSHILSERNKPSLEVVQKILDAFPDVSLAWLMKGTGPMQAAAASPAAAAPTPAVAQAPVAAVPVPPTPAAVVEATARPFSSIPPQPQAFIPPVANAGAPARLPTSAPRPLPPKFRPANAQNTPFQVASETAPVAAEPAETVVTAPPTLPPPPVATVAAVFSAPAEIPVAASIPHAAPAASTSEAPANRHPEYQQTLFAPPALASPATTYASSATSVLPAAAGSPPVPEVPAVAEVAAPNPAAALSFLGEPGKAIRRIVIFYRDGSFSDYVPEGH